MLLPDTGDECREPTVECEQSVAHLLKIYAAKHQLKHGDVRPFRWVETEECLLRAATTYQRERVGAKEHDSASRGMIVSRQRHHLHPVTEADTRDTQQCSASQGSCHCCTSKVANATKYSKPHDISVLKVRCCTTVTPSTRTKFGRQPEKTVTTKHVGQGMARR